MNLVKSSFFVTFLSISVTLISFLNQIVLASFFGTSNQMDILLMGTSIPYMLSAIIGSAFSYYLIPEFVRTFSIKKISEFNFLGRFFLNLNQKILIIILPLTILFYFIIPEIYIYQNSESINLLRTINLLSWINIFITINYSVFVCYLNSKKDFYRPLILNSIPFIFSILFVLILHESFEILSVVIGTVLGNLLILLIIGYRLFKKFHFDYNLEIKLSITKIYPLIFLTMIAMLSFSIFQSIDSIIVPKLGESVMSYTGYAQRLVIAFGSLVITGPSVVLIPRLTENYNNSNFSQYYKDSFLINKLVVLFSSVMSLVMILNSSSVIKILFERGEFDYLATSGVSSLFSYYLIGMIFMLISVVNFRILFTKKVNYRLSVIGLTTAFSYLFFLLILIDLYGQDGIGYAYILTWLIISQMTIYEVFKSNLLNFLDKNLLIFLLKILFVLCIIYISNDLIEVVLENVFNLNCCFLIYTLSKISFQLIVAFISAYYILKIYEFRFVINKLLKR